MAIDMAFEEHKRLKAMTAFIGFTLKDPVLSCLREHLLDEPYHENLKAFKEADKGKGLICCKDFHDFIDKLGLK
ncbi:Uncharacterized protein DB41_DL00030 [Neochlamydia sp. TUME1]|nr:Uncharacterized protein DB41_DL00030 [Neochlamydia sp. TUME1]